MSMNASVRTMRVLRGTAFYVVWALFVILGLLASYQVDPFVFGFFSLASAWATGCVVLVGLVLVVLSRGADARSRLVVASALLVAALAVALSLRVLGGFKWA